MVHPMCGFPIQRGATFLAVTEVILGILYLIQNAVALSMYVPRAYEEYDINTNAENWVEKVPRIYSTKATITLLNSAYWASTLLLGRDLRKCRTWFILTCILTVLFIVDIMMQSFSLRASMAEIASPVVGTLLSTYMAWVVLVFMDDIRQGGCAPIKSHGEIAS
ncbi:hypothetical protein Fcan01_07694 [Folsomia candida]|uniref:Uncharacterized protein n=1 Tax=Folsomia candida TaxID=158441 RepID=A0A226EL44_FOLCA|nr:hypothetical protein Fcan01_07694 [Folsomia candida]